MSETLSERLQSAPQLQRRPTPVTTAHMLGRVRAQSPTPQDFRMCGAYATELSGSNCDSFSVSTEETLRSLE